MKSSDRTSKDTKKVLGKIPPLHSSTGSSSSRSDAIIVTGAEELYQQLNREHDKHSHDKRVSIEGGYDKDKEIQKRSHSR
jgi:hypothetical protein